MKGSKLMDYYMFNLSLLMAGVLGMIIGAAAVSLLHKCPEPQPLNRAGFDDYGHQPLETIEFYDSWESMYQAKR